MNIGTTVDYLIDPVNGGTGTVTDYDEETGLICVIDHEDGQLFRGFEEHIEIRDEQYVTLTVRFEPGQSLPTDDVVIGSEKLGGEIVGVAYYNAASCLKIAQHALEQQATPAAKKTLTLIKAMQAPANQ